MKSIIRFPVVLATVCFVVSTGSAQEPPRGQEGSASGPVTPPMAAQDAPGKREFARAGCDSCHGPDALGGGPAPKLAGFELPYAEFVEIVREGVGEMPPHSEQDVKDEQLASIHEWLRKSATGNAR